MSQCLEEAFIHEHSAEPRLGLVRARGPSGAAEDRDGSGLHLQDSWAFFFFFLKILFIHERYREKQTQAEGEAGFMQEARRGVGLDPGSPESGPRLKAALNR